MSATVPSGAPRQSIETQARLRLEPLEDRVLLNAQLVKDIFTDAGDSNPENLVVLGDKVIFTAQASEGNRELWISDGTLNGTVVAEIREGPLGSYPIGLTKFGNRVSESI